MFDYIIEMVFHYSNKAMSDFTKEGYVTLLTEGYETLPIERFVTTITEERCQTLPTRDV